MIKIFNIFLFVFFISNSQVIAENNDKTSTTINLKHIEGDDVVSVLNTLIDKSISISEKDNILSINGPASNIKNILPIIEQIDTSPSPLTIEFIASNRKIDFEQTSGVYQSNARRSSQSMSITERQWVTLNTGISIPVAERKRYADGTETQSFKYKKISTSYVFKVHEFSGWSVIQVGLDSSELEGGPTGPIEHTELSTTIIGKTGDWLEVTSTNDITSNKNSNIYSTNKPNSRHIYLYVKVIKDKSKINIPTHDNTENKK